MGLEITGGFGTNCTSRVQGANTQSINSTTTSPIAMTSSPSVPSGDSFVSSTGGANPATFQNECPSMPSAVAQMLSDHTTSYNAAYEAGNPDAYGTNNSIQGKVYEMGYNISDAINGQPQSHFPQGSEAQAA